MALARLVLSQQERLVALEPRGNLLQMTTLRMHDEVRVVGEDLDEPQLPKADRQMLEIAQKIIEQRAGGVRSNRVHGSLRRSRQTTDRAQEQGHEPGA